YETEGEEVTGNQRLVVRFTRKKEFAVGERSRRNIAVDFDAIVVVLHRLPEIVRHAEAPIVGIIPGPIWDEVRLVGQRMDMLGELGAAEHSLHWLAVAQDVKIVCGEVDETLSDHARNRAAANVPFHRHMPVEHRGPGFDFMDLQINVPGNDRQGLPYPRTGETS